MTKLRLIQDTAQHVVDAISAAMAVDVGMIDSKFKLVATSSTFLEKRGTDINKDFVAGVYERNIVVLPNPGFNELCTGCKYEGNCPETAEVLSTIKYEGDIIGVILLVAYTQTQKEKLLNNTNELLNFLAQMAKMLCDKIKLNEILEEEIVMKQRLETTIKFSDNGIISIDKDGSVNQINDRAAEILKQKKDALLRRNLSDFLPYSYFSQLIENGQTIKSQEVMIAGPPAIHCLLSGNPVINDQKIVGAVISVKDFKDVRSDIYALSQSQYKYTFDDIHGASSDIEQIKSYAMQIASTDSSILIRGESGTGKELFARAIHNHSNRTCHPFIPINCAAIPEQLLESELFGYEEGAFSGARRGGKPGKFEMAGGGTLFLDEIGDMPLHMQVKLLRVLQERMIERVGGIKSIPVDVRLIAATHRNLEKMVENGTFRRDLYFRLNVIPLHIPPLRSRKSDITVLAEHFLNKYNKKFDTQIDGFTPEALTLLSAYDWPGNARELENSVEYAVNIETGGRIQARSLPASVSKSSSSGGVNHSLTQRVREYEQTIIKETIKIRGDSVEGKKNAARDLGISLPTLYRKLKEHHIE